MKFIPTLGCILAILAIVAACWGCTSMPPPLPSPTRAIEEDGDPVIQRLEELNRRLEAHNRAVLEESEALFERIFARLQQEAN